MLSFSLVAFYQAKLDRGHEREGCDWRAKDLEILNVTTRVFRNYTINVIDMFIYGVKCNQEDNSIQTSM